GHVLDDEVTVGMSISGSLTPAGLGMSCLVPLVEAGFVDWIVSTGANLYHDTHFGLGLSRRRRRPDLDDVKLREDEVVRIYDIVFDYKVLLDTDAFYRRILFAPEFQHEMSTAEFHYKIGHVVAERQRALGLSRKSLVAACHEQGVPVYTSSPGDSSIGMNVAALAIEGCELKIDVSLDVNETAAIGREDRGPHPGRRLAEELPPPDRATGAGGAGHRREGTRLLHPVHRRPRRHWRTLGRDAERGGELGQGRSRQAARHRRLLLRLHGRAPAAGRLRHGEPR